MKKWIIKLVVALLVIAAGVDIVHDFIVNDTIHYFSAQPQQWLTVAAMAIFGGLAVMLLDRLSPRQKRGAELIALGLVVAVLICFVGCFLFSFARLPSGELYSEMRHMLVGVLAGLTVAIVAVCLVFHQVSRRSVE